MQVASSALVLDSSVLFGVKPLEGAIESFSAREAASLLVLGHEPIHLVALEDGVPVLRLFVGDGDHFREPSVLLFADKMVQLTRQVLNFLVVDFLFERGLLLGAYDDATRVGSRD